jgi:hypothetical protein
MHQMTFQRFCAWCGVICVVLFFAAFAIAGFIPPLAPHSSARSIAHFYATHATRIRLGGCVMLVTGMFYAAFTGVISAQMRRIPGIHPSAVYVQLCAGAFACLTFLVPAMLFIVAAFRPDRDPAITQTLNDMGWIFVVMPWPPFMAQNYAFAYAIVTDRAESPVAGAAGLEPAAGTGPGPYRPRFPRWLGYLNFWCPLIYSPAILLPFFKVGPFDWRGIFVFWIPGMVFTIQFIANTAMLLRAIDREQDDVATGGAAAGSPAPQPFAALRGVSAQ